MENVVVSGSFDNLKSSDIRFLEEAARFGSLHVDVWSDEIVNRFEGHDPIFPQAERVYLLQGIRYVSNVQMVNRLFDSDTIQYRHGLNNITWVVDEETDTVQKRQYCAIHGMRYYIIKNAVLENIPEPENDLSKENSYSKKVVVTGCYDWFHSGHLRFFEEASSFGDLYVVVGSDHNVGLLKGEGHPMFSEVERRYIVQSVRFVKQALISSGSGWMDAEPEIARIRPDIYLVNEDGDQPEKRQFCEEHGIKYVVLKRSPKAGLPKRESTFLRGF